MIKYINLIFGYKKYIIFNNIINYNFCNNILFYYNYNIIYYY